MHQYQYQQCVTNKQAIGISRFVRREQQENRRAIVVRSTVNKAVSVPKEAEGGSVQCYSTLQATEEEDPQRSSSS